MKTKKIILYLAVIISLSIAAGACGKIIVYSAKWCHFCVKLQEYLDAHNVKYEKIDTDKNPAAKQEAIDKSGQHGIPVLDWDGEIIIGFSKDQTKEIDRLIAGGAPVAGKFNNPAAEHTENKSPKPQARHYNFNMRGQIRYYENLFNSAVKNTDDPNAANILNKLRDSHITRCIYELTATEQFQKSIDSADCSPDKVAQSAKMIAGYRYCQAFIAFRNAVAKNSAAETEAKTALKDAIAGMMKKQLKDKDPASVNERIQAYFYDCWSCMAIDRTTRNRLSTNFPDQPDLNQDSASIKAKKILDELVLQQEKDASAKTE